jgi:DNA-damage-inducible protein J
MTATAVVRARIDEKTKRQATKALADMGLSVSDAIRLMLVRVASENALPFDVRTPNSETKAAMEAARRGGLRAVNSMDELSSDLDAEDGGLR